MYMYACMYIYISKHTHIHTHTHTHTHICMYIYTPAAVRGEHARVAHDNHQGLRARGCHVESLWVVQEAEIVLDVEVEPAERYTNHEYLSLA